MRAGVFALAALVALTMPAGGHAAEPITRGPAPARAKAFQIGTLSVTSLQDGRVVATNEGKVFGVGVDPAEMGALLRSAGAPTDRITLNTNGLLVRTGRRVILLDTGLGPAFRGSLIESLELAGVAAGAVTDVLITHSHADHVDGLLDARGQLAFPNATVRMTSAEWAWLQQRGAAGLIDAIRPKVRAFEPGAQIAPGVKAVVLAGHTPGHSGYEISSGSTRLLDVGDMVHCSIVSLAKPEWRLAFDSDSPVANATRRATLAKLAADRDWVFAPHFPFPGVGHIVVAGEGFAWEPGVP